MARLLKSSLSLTLSVLSLQAAATTPTSDKVVYGDDDRLEVYEAAGSMKVLAASTAAMISPSNLIKNEDGSFNTTQKTLKENGICEDDPYANQPTPANCSGFLVGPDLLMTAGHCIRSQAACNAQRWVFGFAVDEETKEAGKNIAAENIYSCKLLVNQELISFKGTDHALIQLDRVVSNRLPLNFRAEGAAEVGDPLVVIGHPMGLPTKVADGANIRTNNHPHYFVATLDTFGGNSGSAVFNTNTLTVEGILVRGETDYKYNSQKMCAEIFVCAEDACRGEDVSRITSIIELAQRDVVMEAALKNDVEVVGTYVAQRGWVNMYDNARESILIKAAQGEALEVATIVTQAVAIDVNSKDLKAMTALHHLTAKRDLSVSGIELAKLILSKKADVNAQDELGETALMKAVKSRSVEVVALLLESGADVKLLDKEGKSALSRTSIMGKKQRAIRKMIRAALKKKA